MLFTTIQNLRASSAQQNRVQTVENWLKRQKKDWNPTDKFPVFAIANSNAVDDVEWVFGSRNVLVAWPEMEKAILAEFGHKTTSEHVDYIESQLRVGKAKAIAEITPKYNAAYEKVHAVNPLSTQTAATPAAVAAPAVASPVVIDPPSAKIEAGLNDAPVPAEASAPKSDFAIQGAMYIAIGRIMASKEKSFADACTYATSPTGSRLYAEYAMSNGADGKQAREQLKTFLATPQAVAA